MQYRTMRSTGDDLSVLGAGAMRLPGKRGGIDEQRARTQLYRLIDAGVNYIDTAWAYHAGASEPFLGRILTGTYRDRVHIATKLPYWMVDTRADMDRLLDIQLDRLKTDCIDYYLIHNIGGASWEKMLTLGLVDFMEKAKQSARVRHLGFSSHVGTEDFKAVVDGYDWQFCQLQYNYLDEFAQAGTEGLEYAASKGLGIIIMEPLRGGMLTGLPEHIAEPFDKLGGSYASYGFRWLAEKPGIMTVLSGMNELSQVEENIEIFTDPQPLTDAEHAAVKEVERNILAANKVPCTRCAYCQPCPKEIDIPRIFRVWNERALERNPEPISPELINQAKACIKCRKCERVCPQSIIITDELQRFVKENT